MARRDAELGFEAIRIEGALLSADFLGKVAEETAGQETAESYQLRHGLTLRDETGQAWRVAEAHWRDLEQAGLNRTARERILRAMFKEAFGWGSIAEETSARTIGERSFPLSASALGGMVPVVFGDRDTGLDEAQLRFGDDGRKRSAFGLLQELLNATDESLWGVVTNADTLRIARDNSSLTRPTWIEADLRRIFSEQRYADFSLLWLLLHESRFGTAGAPPHVAILEQWRDKSLEQGTAARDRLRGGVEQALLCLGNGFLRHPSNHKLRDAMTEGRLDPPEFQRQLLRLIYRLIVLVVAEERELLHPPGSTEDAMRWYAAGYGIRRLRERAAKRRAYDRHDDLWDGARIVFRGSAVGEPRLALPGLGGLFAPEQCPDLDAASLGNGALLEAVYHLTWLKEGPALVRVNWRDMGTEELGSVYESLLELEPEIRDGAREYGFVGGSGGSARRLTGSYYTPDSLVQALLDSALDPLIERAVMADDAESALLALTIIDPAMGSGHFLLGAARRIAGELARQRTDGTPGPESYRRALREVISHCIHGVDKNAMAVELARIALWLEAMEPGKPLAFLDHHLIHGDAILGILDAVVLDDGIPDEAFSALAGDDKEVAKQLRARNKEDRKLLAKERKSGQVSIRFDQAGAANAQVALDAMPDDSLEAIAAKQRAYETQRAHEAEQFRLMCDAYVAAFLLPKTIAGLSTVPTTGTLRDITIGVAAKPEITEAIAEVAAETPFLHWPIAFAAVMNRGGFDCVLGNPPWERIKLSEKEFFEHRDTQIFEAPNKAARQELIDKLAAAAPGTRERQLFRRFQADKREADGGATYVRKSGRFLLTGQGDVNLYVLFAETSLQLTRDDGRAGILVPSGIASDAGTAAFFRHIANGELVSLIDFENRDALFPGVHRSYKFCLLTIGRVREPVFAFFLTQADQRFDERRRFTLTQEDLRRLSPNTGTAPIFRSKADADLTAKIYRNVPVLCDETKPDGNPWDLVLVRFLHTAMDSGLFQGHECEACSAVYEAKLFNQFDHRWATYDRDGEGGPRPLTANERSDVYFNVIPRYWISADLVSSWMHERDWNEDWLLAWRNVTNATNERTVIASILPRVGVVETAPLLFAGANELGVATTHALLLVLLNSIAVDYCARQKIGGTHLTYGYIKQLPAWSPAALDAGIRGELVRRAGAILRNTSMLSFVRALEREVGSIQPNAPTEVLRAELDALVAHSFQLTRGDLEYILDPADVMGQSYPSETFRVLKTNEVASYGEYRTRRLVLEAWDRLIGPR